MYFLHIPCPWVTRALTQHGQYFPQALFPGGQPDTEVTLELGVIQDRVARAARCGGVVAGSDGQDVGALPDDLPGETAPRRAAFRAHMVETVERWLAQHRADGIGCRAGDHA